MKRRAPKAARAPSPAKDLIDLTDDMIGTLMGLRAVGYLIGVAGFSGDDLDPDQICEAGHLVEHLAETALAKLRTATEPRKLKAAVEKPRKPRARPARAR